MNRSDKCTCEMDVMEEEPESEPEPPPQQPPEPRPEPVPEPDPDPLTPAAATVTVTDDNSDRDLLDFINRAMIGGYSAVRAVADPNNVVGVLDQVSVIKKEEGEDEPEPGPSNSQVGGLLLLH